MLDQVVFQEYWGGIKVSVYTDRYAYDSSDDSLLFISLAGTEQAVKAVSSALIGHRIVNITRQGNREIQLHGSPAAHLRVLSTKLPSGAVHQLVADTRFFGNDTQENCVIIPQGEDLSTVVYSQVLSRLASPLIPEWAPWICAQLKEQGLIQEMAGTLNVVKARIDEPVVDEIISEGVRTGRISLDQTGGTYAGNH
jgi:hypothetical protein